MIFPIIGLKANDNRVKKEVGKTGPVKAKNERKAESHRRNKNTDKNCQEINLEKEKKSWL